MSDGAPHAKITTPERQPVTLGAVIYDTPDPMGLAAFYAELLDWKVDPDRSDDDWVTVVGEGAAPLAFQLAPDHVRPTWPEGPVPQQAHLDLWVAAYDEPETRALALGATLLKGSDDHPTWRVYADPSGHVFCLCLHE